jgi:serine/threonine-protein kinase
MGDLEGRNLGPYRILEQVGAGGMATVYKAYHAGMDRYVAIKVLPEHLARDPNFRARFQREARTIARLEHRYILPVHDVGEEDGIPYFVMRYTDGGDFGDLIGKGSLSLARAASLVGQVAEALAYAHRQGIIHRDIKPANILIGRDGDPLLTDFGIAKIYEDTLQLTSEGMLVGTPTYMAPEQLQGQPVDARADIYALGVVLYQALIGEPPFVAETPLAVMLMHIHNPLRPPRQSNPSIPEAIERVILRAMAKNPNDRFQTAGEMAEDLRTALIRPTAVMAPVAQPGLPAGIAPTADDQRQTTGEHQAAAATPLTIPATAPAADSPGSAAGVPVAPPTPAARGVPIWVLGAGALILVILALAVVLLRPGFSGGTAGGIAVPTAPGATAAAAATLMPTIVPRAGLSVFGSAADTVGLVALGDAVWAATRGGLVRFDADGQRRVFTTADGLPFNNANTLVAGPDGALWVGSNIGIARVRPSADGLGEVQFYDSTSGLDIGEVRALMVDADGSIWAGGVSYAPHHISRLEGGRWKGLDLPAGDPALNDVQVDVISLLRGRDGALWVGLYEDGILRRDSNGWAHFGAAQGVGNTTITRLFEDQGGTIWAAAGDNGLLRFDSQARSWQRVPVGREDQSIYGIGQLDSSLYVSGNSFIARSEDNGANWATVASNDDDLGSFIHLYARDSGGQIWVGSAEGVSIFAGGQWRRLRPEGDLPMSAIRALAQAPDGKLWAIEQYGGAAASIDPATFKIEPITDLDARINAVAFTKGTTWFGTSGGLVRKRGGATLQLSAADGLPSDNIHQLLATDTTLWIGTDKGLAFYDLTADKVAGTVSELNGGIVEVVFAAPSGEIWAGSQRINGEGMVALARYDGKIWQAWREGSEPLPAESAGVTAISADKQGRVWVSVWNGGLHTWDGAAWKNWAEAEGAPSGNVASFVQDGGALWMTGFDGNLRGALFRWNQDGWARFRVDGLPGNILAARLTADGALWLATGEGLLRLSKEGVAALR